MTQAASRNSVPMRQRIIAVATEMLAERGYEGTSLQRIADEVGLKSPACCTISPAKTRCDRRSSRICLSAMPRSSHRSCSAPPMARTLHAHDGRHHAVLRR